jgi:V/A-type H+-transporting ATPase subunit I
MAIINMKKAWVMAYEQERQVVLDLLNDLGVVEPVQVTESPAGSLLEQHLALPASMPESSPSTDSSRVEKRLGEICYCLDFLQKHFPMKKSFIQQFSGARLEITPEQFQEYISQEEILKEIHEQCRGFDDRLVSFRNEEARLKNTLLELTPWKDTNAPLEMIVDTAKTVVYPGLIPEEAWSVLKTNLAETKTDFYLKEISRENKQVAFLLIFLQQEADLLTPVLKESGSTQVSFQRLDGAMGKNTAPQNLAATQEKIKALAGKREELLSDIQKLLQHRPLLMAAYDFYSNETAKEEVASGLARTRETFILEGWIPEPATPDLKNRLLQETETAMVVFQEPAPGEMPPVLLSNPPSVQPFEVVTRLYSMPKNYEMDPTPWMSPFFLLIFGLCLSDAGYGLLLATGAYLCSRKLNLEGMGRQLVQLLFLGGLSSIFFGIILGSWFGDLLPLRPVWFNPLDDPMRMLIFCFILGLIQIYFGMGLQALQSIKNGRYLDALFDQGFWYLFLTGLVMLLLPSLFAVGKYVAGLGAMGLILTQGRNQKGILKKLFSGVVSLYNVTGYLSDVLSYSRLLALGLATGVIASAINTMGGLLARGIIGMIAMILILVGGHLFNLVISALGSYVHTSRLQYIEFFGKFFEGGGRAFQPFRSRNKYVSIEEQEA